MASNNMDEYEQAVFRNILEQGNQGLEIFTGFLEQLTIGVK